jgi:hypothetical protein
MKSLLLLSALLCPGIASAATFESFDAKGSTYTCGVAIASNGLVAGIATLIAVGTNSTKATTAGQPFLYAAGRFTVPQLKLPAGTVEFTGVNKSRTIIGIDFTPSVTAPSIIVFTAHHGNLAFPAQAAGYAISDLNGITDRGAMLGEVTIPASGQFGLSRTVGFLQSPAGDVTLIDDGSVLVSPRGMDARADRIVGYAFGDTTEGWLFKGGVFSPVGFPGATFIVPAGVDEAGVISGTYFLGQVSSTSPSHGFFLRHGTYTTYDVPGASSTVIQGMNEADQITGCYTDSKGTHGFIQTP